LKAYFSVFVTFIKLGFMTFGGGYAMIPVVDRELIKKKGWITMEEVMDYYTIAQITPGVIAVNLSTFIGYKRLGIFGGVIATAAFVLPGVSLISGAAFLIQNLAHIPAVQHIFAGIRIAVGALILDTIIRMVRGIFKDWKALILYIAAFGLSAVWHVSPALVITGAGIIGFFACREKKQ
jgi:chromate transporter